ncbi:hypothetical protein Q9L58_000560 [Maublancomyces gigas]|uniref:Uncharacterized protein n=1 Tax=Discina gigas TaxID=1032678 RepID=A0ABR3GWE4_9PEZI
MPAIMQKINDKGDARMAPALMLLAVAAGAVEEALVWAVELVLAWAVVELLEEVTVVDSRVVDALVEEEVLEDVVEDVVEDEAAVEALDVLVDERDFVDDDDDDAEEEVTVESMLNMGE